MKVHRIGSRIIAIAFALFSAGSLTVFAQQPPRGGGGAFGGPPVVGKIVSVSSNGLVVALSDGTTMPVRLSDRTRIITRQPASFAAIKKGDFLGVAATRGSDGTLTAVSIGILPAAFLHAGRVGQFPMANGDVMTNAPVTDIVTGVGNHALTMEYGGQTVTIIVPKGALVAKVALAGRGALATGESVSIAGRPANGAMDAFFISVLRS